MYKLPHFTETEQNYIMEFIRSQPFVTVIGNDGFTSVATQVPVLLSEETGTLKLRGHVMRKTDHHLAFLKNNDVLVLFTGPHCYVSASWYSERGIGGTWNYMTVHARGKIELFDDEETIKILTELTHKYEDGQARPELVENMSDSYVNGNVKAIAGFEITIENIHPIFKLSQNRDDESYKSIVGELNKQDDNEAQIIAREMVKRRPQLF